MPKKLVKHPALNKPVQVISGGQAEHIPAAKSPRLIGRASFSGPIPPPSFLAGYDKIVPGAANRIIAMAELQQAHDHKMQLEKLNQPFRAYRRGQRYAFAIAVVLALIGGTIVIFGPPTIITAAIGVLFGAGGIGSIVGIFLGQHQHHSNDSPS